MIVWRFVVRKLFFGGATCGHTWDRALVGLAETIGITPQKRARRKLAVEFFEGGPLSRLPPFFTSFDFCRGRPL